MAGRPSKANKEFDPNMKISAAQMGQLLGFSVHRFRQIIEAGMVEKREDGEYPLATTVQEYVATLHERVKRATGGNDRQRLDAAKAAKAELELSQLQASVIPASEVSKSFEAIAAMVRTRILAVPTKIAPLVRTARSDAEAQSIISRELRDALLDLVNEKR